MARVNVPLSIDAGVKFGLFAGIQVPALSAVLALAVGIPSYFLATHITIGSLGNRVMFVIIATVLAAASGLYQKEGIWIGTFQLYKWIEPYLPRVVVENQVSAGSIRKIPLSQGDHTLHVESTSVPVRIPGIGEKLTQLPRLRGQIQQDGLFERRPGGWVAAVRIEGPDAGPMTSWYLTWTTTLMRWLSNVEVPAQVYCESSSYGRAEAEAAYSASARHPHTKFLEAERLMAGDVANQSIVVKNYVFFMPHIAGYDGIPFASSPTSIAGSQDATKTEAEQVLEKAVRLGRSANFSVVPVPAQELAMLLGRSVVGSKSVSSADGVTLVNGNTYQAYVVATKLPPTLWAGCVIRAVQQAKMRGSVSLYFAPVPANVVNRHLQAERANYKMMLKGNPDDVEASLMVSQANQLQAALASRQTEAARIGLGFQISANDIRSCQEAVERLRAQLLGYGIQTQLVTAPALLPAASVAPGGAPLRRALILTIHEAAAALAPVVGSPFSDLRQPLVGVNVETGAPVYWDAYSQPNHHFVIVGTSGAGKSVSCKTLLARHVAQGARAIVIDPDSEYGPICAALGGSFVELGTVGLNPFSGVPAMDGEDFSNWIDAVCQLLSVMGGDEIGYREGRPIRRLSDADKAWLHSEVVDFLSEWREHEAKEPLLSDFVEHLEVDAVQKVPGEARQERVREIALRLKGFTQGNRARIFNQPTSFSMDAKVISIGLKALSLQYRADDMTPALAFVLTTILSILSQRKERLLILVDEAHRVTSDPDAGQVLDRVIRQARKYGGAVWMASQQVEDFLDTDLGKTLVSNAGTKLVLGMQEAVAHKAQQAFGLTDRELSALSPRFRRGVGVLLCGADRAVVEVLPGPHLLELANTSFLANNAA